MLHSLFRENDTIMKVIISVITIIFLGILFLCMIALTSFGYFSSTSLVTGSISSMESLAATNVTLPTLLLILFGLLLYYYFKVPKKTKLLFLGVIMLLWILSGRVISIIIWPDGRITTGWFYIPTERFYLCNDKSNCETLVAYHTKIETLPFWRVRIKNENTDEIIFVGPFLWNKAKKVFTEEIGAGTYVNKKVTTPTTKK